MIIDPRDEVKRPSKAKHDERTQRKNELDEFYKEIVAPDELVTLHRSIR